MNWAKLKETNTLEDFYNILCRNQPHRNSKLYKEWDYLESITYEELLENNENSQKCDRIINEIITFLERQKEMELKKYAK